MMLPPKCVARRALSTRKMVFPCGLCVSAGNGPAKKEEAKMLMINSIKWAVLLLTAYCLLPIAALAQTGGVKGRVRTMNGAAIQNATITARQDGEDKRSTHSDSKGNFTLTGLEPGVYSLVFDAPGYAAGLKSNIQVRNGKTTDLGDNLRLMVDRGTLVIVQGSVFFRNGTTVTAAKVEVEKVNADGTTQKLGTVWTNYQGEFSFKKAEGAAKLRFTAKYHDATASKEIDVDSAAIYRTAISLDINRDQK
jgi:hypothetical protein